MIFHFISVLATRNCGFSERAGNPHNLCSCSNILHHNCGPQKPSNYWLNSPESHQFHFSPPENTRNKTDQALMEWPKGHLHSVSTTIQRRKVMKWRKKCLLQSVAPRTFTIVLHCWSCNQKALVAAVVCWKGPTHNHWIADKLLSEANCVLIKIEQGLLHILVLAYWEIPE